MKKLILGAVWLAVLLESGCSRYADFTLPPGGRQRTIAWRVREAVRPRCWSAAHPVSGTPTTY